MKRKALEILTLAGLTLASALPVAAQSTRPSVRVDAPLHVISLQARVDGRGESYSIKSDEPIPIRVGERLRVELVGTVMVNGSGVERPINAQFREAAGRQSIDIVQTGPNWVVVEARNQGGNGLAQLGYVVNGNYDMKGGLREGRITFEIGEGFRGTQPSQGVQGDRWNRAQDLNWRLYTSILNQDPRGTTAENDLNHIYRLGYGGVRDVALELAREANLDNRRLSEDDAVAILGDLYRGLLRRNASDRELWDTDRGFRGNVQALRDHGLERVVQSIVDSAEFRSVNQMSELDPLYGNQLPPDYSTETWRRDRGRPIRY